MATVETVPPTPTPAPELPAGDLLALIALGVEGDLDVDELTDVDVAAIGAALAADADEPDDEDGAAGGTMMRPATPPGRAAPDGGPTLADWAALDDDRDDEAELGLLPDLDLAWIDTLDDNELEAMTSWLEEEAS